MSNKVIQVNHTSIVIPNYNLGDNEKIEKMLSIWNDSYFRFDPVGFYYKEETKELLLPRGLDINYLEREFNIPAQINYEPDEFDKVSFRLKVEPRNDIQRKSISFLLGEGDFQYTKKHSQLSLNLDTGDGKTYCVIAALTFFKMKSLIITHNDNIKNQWISSLLKMTDLDEKFILNIEGSSVINKIMKSKKLNYKVYLVNHRTIQSYAKKNGWDSITELFKKLKIGVKVFDEAHLEFENLIRTDLHTNTKKTIYLTANFERSQYNENRVFKLCFKNIVKFGHETRKEKRKHIIYIPIFFNSNPSLTERASMRGRHGFDKNKYCDYHTEKKIMYDVVKYTLDYFKDKEGKILLLFTKIMATEIFFNFIKENYPDKTVAVYNSQITEEEKIKALEADIIVSTPKSMGTGTDIPGLRFVIMAEPYSSSITANQTSGRLREYSIDAYTFYIELIDKGFPDVLAMYKKRLPILRKKCVKVLELNFNIDLT